MEQVVGICASCNKPIYADEPIRRADVSYIDENGIKKFYLNQVVCNVCYERIQKEERRKKEKAHQNLLHEEKLRRTRGYIGGGIAAFFCLIIHFGIDNSGFFLFLALASYTFIGSLCLKNNLLGNLNLWGRIDSLLVKILLTLLCWAPLLLMFLCAILIGLPLSIIAYPILLVKSIRISKNLKN